MCGNDVPVTVIESGRFRTRPCRVRIIGACNGPNMVTVESAMGSASPPDLEIRSARGSAVTRKATWLTSSSIVLPPLESSSARFVVPVTRSVASRSRRSAPTFKFPTCARAWSVGVIPRLSRTNIVVMVPCLCLAEPGLPVGRCQPRPQARVCSHGEGRQ